MKFLKHFSALLIFATGCGSQATTQAVTPAVQAPKAAPIEAKYFDEELMKRVEAGELDLLYGSFFEGTVRPSPVFAYEKAYLVTALPGSPTPGTVHVTFWRGDAAPIKPGKRVRVFVNYTFVEVKTGKVAFARRPYQASMMER